MTKLLIAGFNAMPEGRKPQTPRIPAPPLRLPRHLLEHLARPLNNADDVEALMAHIRVAEQRGLL